ncbi:MAG: alpha/beta fold hydrolase [Mogibacterium sp.]|nr:alpha/beta fold hydrolase [Mogibacterium sp.]
MRRENVTVGLGTEFPLNGMLTLPDNVDVTRPVPAVVMVHGSGSSNMDEKVMKLTPFKDLADGLAQHGIASLRYDKRTFAHARKMVRMDMSGMTVREETIDDAIMALDILRKDPRIDSDRLFILGHSMGAMLAPRIDAEGGNVRGLIMMAGTPYRLEDIVVRQLNQAGGKGLLKWVVGLESRIYSGKFDRLYEMTDEEAKKTKFAGTVYLYYFKEMGQKTATDYLLESDKPALIMQGGRDFQVLAEVDFAGFKEQLKDRDKITYKLYPDLNHIFVPALYDDILKASKEYSTERHIGEDVIGDIAAFIEDNK